MPISWYPRNFTNPDIDFFDSNQYTLGNDILYSVQLGLYVIGYKEAKDDQVTYNQQHRSPRDSITSVHVTDKEVPACAPSALSAGHIRKPQRLLASVHCTEGAYQPLPGGAVVYE